MKILISNDDGIESSGILELAKALSSVGEVTVVAPHRERSTAGHSLTLHKPLRIHKLAEGLYSTSGTPADCVYLGVREILKEKPDIVVSGINRGANLGTDIYYSGTVAAAREAALIGIKSYAFSLVDMQQICPDAEPRDYDFKMAAGFAKSVVEKTLQVPFPQYSVLNVNIPNIPADQVRGIRSARQAVRFYGEDVQQGQDPRGRAYYWIGGVYEKFHGCGETDCDFVKDGWVVTTPLDIDATHKEFYTTLRGMWPE